MFRMTLRDRRIALTASRRSLRTSTASALSMATSVPAPMAMPRSAATSAGASFTPSPIMATRRPSRCRRSTWARLSAGRTPAITSVMPSRAAIARAVRSSSPVSMMGMRFIAFICATAAALVGFSASRTPRRPTMRPARTTMSAVSPRSAISARAVSTASASGMPSSARRAALPAAQSTPATRARTPLPNTAAKSAAAGTVSPLSAA